MSTKAEQAIAFHDKGYNCAQAVACSFCKEFGVDEEEMFRIAEGFGLGMGMMEVCGALSGMMMIIGLQNSVGNLDKGKATKGDTYKKVREYAAKFKEQNGSYLCKELKGVETGKVLRSCPDCIRDAVALTEEYLAAQKDIEE
ncbi:MAG: C-GCAxxG-C-C family protein [Ruminococcus sp.]|nr:C-GCAxxG-C-C family protein [Ruminococcus sp.]